MNEEEKKKKTKKEEMTCEIKITKRNMRRRRKRTKE